MEEVTDYPWDGRVSFRISACNGVPFRLLARVPAFAGGGFRELDINDPAIEFDMTPRLIRAHAKLEENESSVCVMRGPVVYCAEMEDLSGLYLSSNAEFTSERADIAGENVVTLKTKGWRLSSTPSNLYEEVGGAALVPEEISLIPYFEWDNSGFKEMRIWIPVRYDVKINISGVKVWNTRSRWSTRACPSAWSNGWKRSSRKFSKGTNSPSSPCRTPPSSPTR